MATAKQNKAASAAHAAGLFADMSLDGPEIGTLVAVVDRAKNLPNRKTMGKQNPYCAMRLGKIAKKTETDKRGGQTPKWDQELRFTVYESPDYYKLKCSVFNDDKKTDMIGEAWINLTDLIKPGGGSTDVWHQLNYKGKYAGDVRVELSYYDTRPKEEKISEKKKSREKAPSPATEIANAVSGPRQLGPRDVRRRPLPASPVATSPAQTPPASTPQEQPSPAPAPPPKIPHDHQSSQALQSQSVSMAQPVQPMYSGQLPQQYSQPPHHQSMSVSTHRQSLPQQSLNQYAPQPLESHDEFYDLDPHESDYAVTQLPTHQHRQSYHEEQSHFSSSEFQSRAEPEDMYDETHDYSYSGQELARHSTSSLPQSTWPDEAEIWNQSSRRKSQQPAAPAYEHHHQGQMASSPPVHSPDSSPHYSPRTSVSPVKALPYRDSPLRHSMTPRDSDMGMSDEPEFYDAPPPPPPKHRDSTPRRHQPEFPPSSFPQYDTPSPAYSTPPSQSRPRRTSINERSPLQSIEHEYDSYSQSHQPPSNTATKRLSYCEPYVEEDYDRRHSQSSHRDSYVPERHDSYDSYQNRDFSAPNAESYQQPPRERASRELSHQRPHHRDRSGSYDDRQQMNDSPYPNESHSLVPYASSQPNLHTTTYHKPQPVRPRPIVSTSSSTTPRKAVSSGPYPEQLTRRLSDQPFGPDAYDVLNPASSPVTNDGTIFQTPEQAKEASRMKESERFQDDTPIIGNDGRVIDPSDHLPSDTWAPEPERKQRKPEHVVHVRTKNDGRSRCKPHSTPVPVRSTYHKQSSSHNTASRSPDSRPSSHHDRAQQPGMNRPLPPQPYPQARPEKIASSEAVNQQALQRYSYQNTSNAIHRPQLSEYQVPAANSYVPRGSSYQNEYTSTPPKMSMQAGRDYSPGYSGNFSDPLSAEMSMIDIGPSRDQRMVLRGRGY